MFADTHDELATFAARLDLRDEWIQHLGTHREHFDFIDAKQNQVIALGSVPISCPH